VGKGTAGKPGEGQAVDGLPAYIILAVHGHLAREVYIAELLGQRQCPMENLGLKGIDANSNYLSDRIYRIYMIYKNYLFFVSG
jgi:hypothetical protein